jgi:hypothetical protein
MMLKAKPPRLDLHLDGAVFVVDFFILPKGEFYS